MTALCLQTKRLVEMVAPKLRTEYGRLLRALDAFAESRMRHAMPRRRLGRQP